MFILGPMLFTRPVPAACDTAKVPNYAFIQDDLNDEESTHNKVPTENDAQVTATPTDDDREKALVSTGAHQLTNKEVMV